MNIVKKVAKYLVVGFLLLNFIKPLSIPKLPPVELMAETVSTVHFS